MQLSKKEELLITHLWSLGKAYMKDLINCYEVPKPAATTIATLLKRMKDKGYVDYESEGRSRLYYAKVKKEEYVNGQFKGFMNNFFEDSASQFASFFTKKTNMSKKELEALRVLIDQQIERKS
jgi:predicted transcriptional regulator